MTSRIVIQATLNHSVHTAEFDIARDILGDDFEVWVNEGQWRFVSDHRQTESYIAQQIGSELFLHLSQMSDGSRSKFEPLNNGQTLCLLALTNHGKLRVAIRVLPRASCELMQIAARAAEVAMANHGRHESMQRRLYESESQLAAFSNRISRGEAELNWLHQLATHSELNETHNDPIQVAQKILPDMRRIISARSVVFVSEPTGLDVDGIPMNAWQTGKSSVPDGVSRSLIKEFGATALHKPAVINNPVPQFRAPGFAGVLSAVIKSVSRNGRLAGWLLAVNKDLSDVARLSDEERGPGTFDRICEFGSFESSLVCAAANALATHAHNCHLLEEKQELVSGTIRSLVNAIDAKDHYTCGHSDRVAEYARQIAATMKMDVEFCEQIYMTGLLHDVGKIGVPDNVLQKPGRLSADEFKKIKEHPVIGHQILRHLADFDYVLPGVLHHHESVDGTGYPLGLVGEQIPLDARILAVADAYDAMTSDRPYRDGMPTEKAEAIIADGAGKQWDSDCVAAFQRCIDGIRLIGHDDHRHAAPVPNIVSDGLDRR